MHACRSTLEDPTELALAAAIREKGPDHTDAAWPLRGLASVAMDLGQLDTARRHLEQSLALRERVHGPDHWEIAMSLEDLAEVARLQKDHRAEESHLRRAVAIYRKAYGPSHPDTTLAIAQLGGALCRNGRPTEGKALLSEAVNLRQTTSGNGDPELAVWRRSRDACSPGH